LSERRLRHAVGVLLVDQTHTLLVELSVPVSAQSTSVDPMTAEARGGPKAGLPEREYVSALDQEQASRPERRS
jgi:hypothetical protein